MIFPWAQRLVDIIVAHGALELDREHAISALTHDGLYLQQDTHDKLINALHQEGIGGIIDKDSGRLTVDGLDRGIAFSRDEDEPECLVWWFYSNLMT